MMLRPVAAVLTCIALLAAGTATATETLTVTAPWVRGTVPGQSATGAFMELTSKVDAILVGASSPAAGLVEIHEMKTEGGVMRMRKASRVDLPAGRKISLTGDYHVMLMDLKQPLKKGDVVTLLLQLEGKDKKREAVEVKAEVRDLTATATDAEHAHHH